MIIMNATLWITIKIFIELPYCASQSKRAESAAVQQGQQP
jgi:hypothetical protein